MPQTICIRLNDRRDVSRSLRLLRIQETHRVAHRDNALGFLVADLAAEFLLERHNQLNQV